MKTDDKLVIAKISKYDETWDRFDLLGSISYWFSPREGEDFNYQNLWREGPMNFSNTPARLNNVKGTKCDGTTMIFDCNAGLYRLTEFHVIHGE
jgi:hypothetical protein